MRLIVAVLVTLVCGMAVADDDVRVAESWTAPEVEHEMKKILVVGITADKEARRNFENKFVSHLRGRDYDGATSFRKGSGDFVQDVLGTLKLARLL